MKTTVLDEYFKNLPTFRVKKLRMQNLVHYRGDQTAEVTHNYVQVRVVILRLMSHQLSMLAYTTEEMPGI